MKYILCAALALLTLSNCEEKNKSFNASEITLLPKPVSLDLQASSFALKKDQVIFSNLEEQESAIKDFQTFMDKTSGFKFSVIEDSKASISFEKKGRIGSRSL